MGAADLVTAALVLAASGWLLYRSPLVRRGGGCHGCGAGACRPAGQDVVRLGPPPSATPPEAARRGRAPP